MLEGERSRLKGLRGALFEDEEESRDRGKG